LDVNRAVEVSISKDGTLVSTKIWCARCFDADIDPNPKRMSKKLGFDVTVEVIDGRDYDEDGFYDPIKCKVSTKKVQFRAARINPEGEVVTGRMVDIGLDWVKLVTYKNDKGGVFVCEYTTGFSVSGMAYCKNLKDQIPIIARKIRETGKEKFMAAVAVKPVLNPA
jgi:hypothetical protein